MNQVKEVVKQTLSGLLDAPSSAAELVTRSVKDVMYFDYSDGRSVLVITKNKPSFSRPKDGLGAILASTAESQGFFLSGVFVCKSIDSNNVHEVLYHWSDSAATTVLQYSLALRVWGTLRFSQSLDPATASLVSKYCSISTDSTPGLCNCLASSSSISIDDDVKTIDETAGKDSAEGRLYAACYDAATNFLQKQTIQRESAAVLDRSLMSFSSAKREHPSLSIRKMQLAPLVQKR
jgi:hypothetical protein